MKALDLTDLQPETGEFHLRKTGKTYKLRPVTLADEAWLAKTFGAELPDIVRTMRMRELCQMVFHLMDLDSKREFKAQDFVEIDAAGEEKTVRKGGAELLLESITGIPEKIVIYKALLQTIGVSRPMQEQIERDTREALEKKRQPPSAGEPPSTSSPPSTAGPGSTSGDSLPEPSTSP